MTMTEKRQVTLTLSREFPKGHKKAGHTTTFAILVYCKRKLHTIRDDAKGLWAKRVDDINSGKKLLSLREWKGRPYHSEQTEIKRLVHTGLQKLTMTYGADDAVPRCWVDDKEVPVEVLAKNDGLSVEDFVDWFFGAGSKSKGNVFEGVIIHFTDDFRY